MSSLNNPTKKKASVKILHWLPRLICVLAILFISLFAADAFAPELTLREQLVGFLIHLIPSFVLLAILIISWKRELVGGIIFIIIGVIMSLFVFKHNYKMNHSVSMSLAIVLMITFPFVVAGILFVLSHYFKKKNVHKSPT